MDNSTSLFDMRVYRRERIEALQPRYAWEKAAEKRNDDVARTEWQTDFRAEFACVLGGLAEWERPPLDAEVIEIQQAEGYRREAVVFTTRPGLRAFGWFLIPDHCPLGQPTILCSPGHGIGVDGMVGLVAEGYSSDFALQCVRRGYPTFALEPISFGHRRDAAARAQGPTASSCARDSVAALMLGETIAGWRAWDAMRAVDYLMTRTEVDPTRIATMGISGGGLISLFTAALDTRIAAVVVSGYFNAFSASVLSIDHCVDNYAPGLLALCEMPDLAALIAPRALFVESGTVDHIFPLPAFEQAVAQARDIFGHFGVPERFDAEVFEGGHRFHGVGAFDFLEQQLH